MGSKRNITKFIIGGFIFAFALIIIQVIKKSETSTRSSRLTKLPSFRSSDSSGNSINTNSFEGKNLYIQFVNPWDFDDLDLIKTVYFNWKDENIILVAITNNFERFKLKSGISLQDIIVISNDYEKLKSKFNSPYYAGTYYLFNNLGTIVNTGKNSIGYEKELKSFLKQIVKNEYFSISDVIKANENIRNIDWFRQVAEIVEKENKKYFIISLFTSFCGSCKSGAIINELKKIYSDNQNPTYVLSILNADFYGPEDINSIKSQSGIDFPIIIADQLLNQKWSSLINEYREIDLTNIIFIVNKFGNIERIYDNNCKCDKSFFNYMYSLVKI